MKHEQIFQNGNKTVNQWFSEHCPMWPGMALSVEVEEKVWEVQTPYQHLEVYRTATYGHMLVLDGKIQCTERDEFAYHEMLVHPALFAHPAPETVLIVGGGDGGALREAAKHASVKRMVLCEIDQAVIDVSRHFFKDCSSGFDDPRTEIVCADAVRWLQESGERFDIILVDSSDPFGPAEALFEAPFYQTVAAHLKTDGIAAAQSEHYFIHPATVEQLKNAMLSVFPHYTYLSVSVPSYPGGGLGMALGGWHDLTCPARSVPPEMALRYYTSELHRACGILPRFAAKDSGHA